MRKQTRAVVVFCLVATMVAANCSADDDDDATPADTGPPSATSDTVLSTAAPTDSTGSAGTPAPAITSAVTDVTVETTAGSGSGDSQSTFEEGGARVEIVEPREWVTYSGGEFPADSDVGDGRTPTCLYESNRLVVIADEDTDPDLIIDWVQSGLSNPDNQTGLQRLDEPFGVYDINDDAAALAYRLGWPNPGDDPLDVAFALDANLIAGVQRVAPNYAFSLAPQYILGPGTWWEEADFASVVQPTSAEPVVDVNVGMVDSGAARTVIDDNVLGSLSSESASMTLVGSGSDSGVDYWQGHGTFGAVMIARLLPGVTLHMENAPFEVNIAQPLTGSIELASDFALGKALTDRFLVDEDGSDGPDVVFDALNLSLGSYGCPSSGDDEYEQPERVRMPPATRDALLRLLVEEAVETVVAAAGNDATRKAFFPAAYSVDPYFLENISKPSACTDGESTPPDDVSHSNWLISVGSGPSAQVTDAPDPSLPIAERYLRPNAIPRPDYSNFGCWVRVRGDGSDIVSFDGQVWKRWSGTSFAAPCFVAHLLHGNGVPNDPEPANDDVTGGVSCALKPEATP